MEYYGSQRKKIRKERFNINVYGVGNARDMAKIGFWKKDKDEVRYTKWRRGESW